MEVTFPLGAIQAVSDRARGEHLRPDLIGAVGMIVDVQGNSHCAESVQICGDLLILIGPIRMYNGDPQLPKACGHFGPIECEAFIDLAGDAPCRAHLDEYRAVCAPQSREVGRRERRRRTRLGEPATAFETAFCGSTCSTKTHTSHAAER